MWKKVAILAGGALVALAFVVGFSPRADEFTQQDLERYDKEYMTVVKQGRELWTSGSLGTNGVACAQCHPNAANTHPETYPNSRSNWAG